MSNGTMKNNSSLASQVSKILDDKIARISRKAYADANTLPNGRKRAKHVPYTLPQIVNQLVTFRAECADENTSNARLEAIATFATSGESMHLAFAK